MSTSPDEAGFDGADLAERVYRGQGSQRQVDDTKALTCLATKGPPAEHLNRTRPSDSDRVVTDGCAICTRSAVRCRCATSVRRTVIAVLLLVADLILFGWFFYLEWAP
jgi:hypothetical protein